MKNEQSKLLETEEMLRRKWLDKSKEISAKGNEARASRIGLDFEELRKAGWTIITHEEKCRFH